MSKVDSAYQNIIDSAVRQIIALPDGHVGLLEDFLGQKFDTFTLLSIGSTIEPMLREYKIWLKFDGEYDCFQCKYKFPFQKGTEFFLTINNVFSPHDPRQKQDNALIEKCEIYVSKDVTVNGRVTFLNKKDNRQIVINKDFTKNQTINITHISNVIRKIRQKDRYVRRNHILHEDHFDKSIIKINGVEYLFDINDSLICELIDIVNLHDMYNSIIEEKKKGIQQGLYPEYI